MDVHSPEQRSKNMAAIKSTATKAEVRLGRALWHSGLRYRKNNKTVFGKPDFTFKKYKVAVFVDSEFFHGKDWDTRKRPLTNAEFWVKKIERNMQRDIEVNTHLREQGWTVLRFWSAQVKKDLDCCVAQIQQAIRERANS
ncbi:MAG: very short patch repair endonuclease [Flavobacterium sp.]